MRTHSVWSWPQHVAVSTARMFPTWVSAVSSLVRAPFLKTSLSHRPTLGRPSLRQTREHKELYEPFILHPLMRARGAAVSSPVLAATSLQRTLRHRRLHRDVRPPSPHQSAARSRIAPRAASTLTMPAPILRVVCPRSRRYNALSTGLAGVGDATFPSIATR